jgi:uncharacterized protein YhaN
MRLNRLDLTRYGRFSDAQIVLPGPTGDTADVTVIYGPNEAGKSTAFTAYLELLFGMKTRDHPYDFRFKRSDLLVGAELDLPNRGRVVLQRNSKKTQSLLDDQGRPVEDTFLTAALHGLRRDDYVERFSLNDDGLRIGGARIAGAQGDLGQLLHAGVSGLTSMATMLDQMGARADQFHKKGGRGTALKVGKDRLTEIGQDLRANSLTPERERVLAAANGTAEAAFDAADVELGTARLRETASKAAQLWYEQTDEICVIDADLLKFPDGPDLRKGAPERIASLVETIKEKSLRKSEVYESTVALGKVITDNPADAVAEEMATELEQLDKLTIDGAPLMARATTAASDLGNRIMDRDVLCDQIDQILSGLSIPDVPAASLVLSSRELEDLAQAAQAILTGQNAVEATMDAALSAKEQQGDAPPKPQDLSQLETVWDKWQTVADVTALQTAVTTETARLATAVAGLPKAWSDLVDAGLPARETLIDVARHIPSVSAEMVSAETELETRDAEYRIAHSKRQADEATPSAIDVVMTGQARRLRDQKWAAHRGDLSAQTADEFEAAMHSDDDAQASFAIGSEARGQLATARRDENMAMVLRDKAQERFNRATLKHSELIAQSGELAAALGLAQDTNTAAFTDRYGALVQAAQTAAQLENSQAELETLNDRRVAANAELMIFAKLVGIDCVDSDLPTQVRAALTLQDSIRKAWAQWTRVNDAVADLVSKASQAVSDKERSEHTLTVLTVALPLAGRMAQDVIAALPHLRNLQRLHNEHEKLALRIEALESAVAKMSASAMRINAIAGEAEDPKADPLVVIEKARSRVLTAQNATKLRDDAERRQTAEKTISNVAANAIDEAQAELLEWFMGQGGEDLEPAARASLLTERDALRATRKTQSMDRNKAREGAKAALFDEELALLPNASRAAEVQQLLSDTQEARDHALNTRRDTARLYQEAFDAADRSELATEQATLREELRSGARRAAVARLGVLAAKGALRRLASERRTTMLRDVEEAFVAITAPAWTNVDVWSQTEGEKLVGIQPDGSAVPVEMMSTGTMGQLYFALRVAGYRSFARELGPLPMILDDIMETFDDGRARAALQLCSDIGLSGQAIIFTHHAHLVDLALETIPHVNIVNMPH